MLKKIGTDNMRKSIGEILDCKSRFAKSFSLDMISDHIATQNEEEIDSLADEAKHTSRNKKLRQKKKAL